MEPTDNYKLRKVKGRVKKLKDFYRHILVMVIAIPVVIYINLTFSPEFHWFWIAIWGMLFSIVMNWLGNFRFGDEWEEKKIKELMNKNRK